MPKFFIKLGTFNKILLFPFLLALSKIILFIFEAYYPEKQRNIILDGISKSFGQMAIKIIPYLKCFSLSNQKEKIKCKSECTKKNCLHYFILLFLFTIDIVAISYSKLKLTDQIKINISDFVSTKDAIIIILITILAKLLLKYEYFIHHILSIISFVLISVSIDLLLNNYLFLSKANLILILCNSLSIMTKAAYLCFIKYMIDKQYHYYWNIALSHGILLLSIFSLLLFIFLMIPKGEEDFIDTEFYNYFDKVPVVIMIFKFILNFILQFIFYGLQMLTIFYLSPEYILISDSLVRILYFFFIHYENYKVYICIIFFILQFFSLFVYLELLELDCLNLNKNTKRNIKLRVDEDSNERKGSVDSNNFEVGDGYIVENQKYEKANRNEENDYIELGQLQNKKENETVTNNEN
jgi:hypothetical protein